MAKPRKVDRKDRVPFGTMKSKLTLDAQTVKRFADQGKVPRFVNDADGGVRIGQAQAGGYEFVTADGSEFIGTPDGTMGPESGSLITKPAGKDENGKSYRAYLMAIDKDLYEEDQAAKEEVNKKVDDAIRGGTLANGGTEVIPGKGKSYIKQADYKP